MTAAAGLTIPFPAVHLGPRGQTPLRHLVLLMRENRSFDHYFGTYRGAEGLPIGAPVTRATADCLPDPAHDEAALQALAGGATAVSPDARTVYTESRIPLAWALARRFTLCDHYFASVLAPTFPNRLFSVAASAGDYRDNPARFEPARLPRPNILDRLDAARLDWGCYLASVPDTHGYNAVAFYPERAADPRANRTFADFVSDSARGRLPAVSWVVPEDPLSEHPPTPPQWGQRFAALAVSAVQAGPQWPHTAVVLNYDESGGFYDHVRPPPVGGHSLGFRVPCVVASPFAKPGHVSHDVHDHASVLALIESTFGLSALNDRDGAASPLADCFDFDHPNPAPVEYPTSSPLPNCQELPRWAADLLMQPLPSASTDDHRGLELAAALGGVAAGLAGGAAAAWRLRRDRSAMSGP